MRTFMLSLIIILCFFGISFAADQVPNPTLLKLKDASSSELLIDSVPEAKTFSDKSLSIYVARQLARNYPFSPTAGQLLSNARNSDQITEFKGGSFWLFPITLLRLLVIFAGLLMLPKFEMNSFRTYLFSILFFVLIIGEGINYSRDLFAPVFIPFAGDHYSFSAPELNSQAVEKLTPGAEIKISENNEDWLKLELPSGRVGWVMSKDGIIESED